MKVLKIDDCFIDLRKVVLVDRIAQDTGKFYFFVGLDQYSIKISEHFDENENMYREEIGKNMIKAYKAICEKRAKIVTEWLNNTYCKSEIENIIRDDLLKIK